MGTILIAIVAAILIAAYTPGWTKKKKESPHIRLTMKAIIRWEQLNQKPFSELNYNSEDDITSLFYTCTLSDEAQLSLGEFRTGLTEASAKNMIHEFEKQTSHITQFQATAKENAENKSEPSEPTYIKDVVAKLVMNGLDVFFAMNDMELCDLPVFLEAYDQNIKDKLESQRLSIFWMLRPHVSDKIKQPKDLYQFPWDEGVKKEAITQSQWDDAERILKNMKRN